MQRRQLIELEDQPWVPATLRDYLTEGIQHMHMWMEMYAPILPILQRLVANAGTTQVVDLCSGATGPWSHLYPALADAGVELQLTLTDKYPNVAAFTRLREALGEGVTFHATAVDALQVPAELQGMRTLFTGFHHFPPDAARAILADAAGQRRAIGIFEFTHRSALAVASSFIGSPLAAFLTTPFQRPMTPGRLFWTYVVPLLPAMAMWDGTVSNLRTYNPPELLQMVEGLDGFTWEADEVSSSVPGPPLTYLIGWPSTDA